MKSEDPPHSLSWILDILAAVRHAGPVRAGGDPDFESGPTDVRETLDPADTVPGDDAVFRPGAPVPGAEADETPSTWPWLDGQPTFGFPEGPEAEEPSAGRARPAPERVGRFQIVRELGRGGFGVVYLALDPALGRRVALKVAHRERMAHPGFRRRFLREARATSRLDHPGIVPVYEAGRAGDDCYIALAYCEGPTLAQWLADREGPVPPRQAAVLTRAIAQALAHAHRRGILHRDLKPRNVLLQPAPAGPADDPGVIPRVCDYGLAKLLDEDHDETAPGVQIGSPPYMAPEQAEGRSGACGPATDVYALGAILYELLTGRPPFRGETREQTLLQVVALEPIPPRRLRPGIPADLETVCLSCLEKSPARRYPTADALIGDLGRLLEGMPVRARRAPLRVRAWRLARRRPWLSALAALVVAMSLGVFGTLLWATAWLRQHNVELQAATETARRNEREALHHYQVAVAREHAALRARLGGQIQMAYRAPVYGDLGSAARLFGALRDDLDRIYPLGFVGRHLRLACAGPLAILEGHRRGVLALAVSPDGRTLATASEDTTVRLWDLATGRCRSVLSGHRSAVLRLAFAPDGRTLASASGWTPWFELKVWDIASGREWPDVPDVDPHPAFVRFTPDGTTLVFGTPRATDPAGLTAWELDPRARRAAARPVSFTRRLRVGRAGRDGGLAAADDPLGAVLRSYGAAVLPDGRTFAVDRGRGTFDLYDRETGDLLAVARGDGPVLRAVVIAGYNRTRPAGSPGMARAEEALSQAAGGRTVRLVEAGPAVTAATFADDGRAVGVARGDFQAALLDVATGREVLCFRPAAPTAIRSMTYLDDGATLILGGNDARAYVWRTDRARAGAVRAATAHGKEIWAITFSPDGRTLATAGDDHLVKLWDAATGHPLGTLSGHTSLVTAVAFTGDGRTLASASYDRTIRLWDVAARTTRSVLTGHRDAVRALAISADGTTLASGDRRGELRLWDATAGRPLGPPSPGSAAGRPVLSLAFAPDGSRLACGTGDRRVALWDVATRRPISGRSLTADPLALAFAPDGRSFASGDAEGRVTLHHAATCRATLSLLGHTDEVLGLAFDPTGECLASCGKDRTVRVWDPQTGQELMTLPGHGREVHGLAFAPDSSALATGDYGGGLRVWLAGRE